MGSLQNTFTIPLYILNCPKIAHLLKNIKPANTPGRGVNIPAFYPIQGTNTSSPHSSLAICLQKADGTDNNKGTLR